MKRIVGSWVAVLLLFQLPVFAQAFQSVLLPETVEGMNGTNSNRIPFAFRARLTGLRPGAAYRFINLMVTSGDLPTANGAGNCIFVPPDGDFLRTTSPGLGTSGSYGELCTDQSGEYEGWFVTEPTGNARFTPGSFVFVRIVLNDGEGGSSAVHRITSADSIRVVRLDTSASGGTGLRGSGGGSPRAFVFAYSDSAGRPVSGTFIESDGTDNSTANGYASFYSSRVNGTAGAFGLILPNTLPRGIRRIECRAREGGHVIASSVQSDGIWPGGVSTINPRGGTSELVLGDLALPIRLAWLRARADDGVLLEWMTLSELRTYGFFVQRCDHGALAWMELPGSFVPGHGTTLEPHQYTYRDETTPSGVVQYRLRHLDLDGTSCVTDAVSVMTSSVHPAGGTGGGDLLVCWPVPSRSGVDFGFRIVDFGVAKLAVYDLLGRELSVLVHEARMPGDYHARWETGTLASGTYICRLTSGSTTRSVRFQVTR